MQEYESFLLKSSALVLEFTKEQWLIIKSFASIYIAKISIQDFIQVCNSVGSFVQLIQLIYSEWGKTGFHKILLSDIKARPFQAAHISDRTRVVQIDKLK